MQIASIGSTHGDLLLTGQPHGKMPTYGGLNETMQVLNCILTSWMAMKRARHDHGE